MARFGLKESLRAYAVLMAYLVAIKLVILTIGTEAAGFRSPSQAAVFGWLAILSFTVVGGIAVWVDHKVGLRGVWPPEVPLRDRLLIPVALGVLLGAVSIGVDQVTHWTQVSAEQMGIPSIHIAFPASLLIYPGGAIIVNVLYYLVPITLVVGLVSLATSSPRARTTAFWVAGVLAAAIEPATQGSSNGIGPSLVVVFFAQDYLFNLAQVWMFWRAGFGASVALRVSMYLIWHVLYGFLQQ